MLISKLSEAQRLILATAAARPNGNVLPLPDGLGHDRRKRDLLLNTLIVRQLVIEHAASEGDIAPRAAGKHHNITALVISARARALMAAWRHAPLPSAAVDMPEAVPGAADTASPHPVQRSRNHPGGPPSNCPPSLPNDGTKLAALILALRRPSGASIPELMAATNWQAHSVRGAISRSLRKKLGLNISSQWVPRRGRVYRLWVGTRLLDRAGHNQQWD